MRMLRELCPLCAVGGEYEACRSTGGALMTVRRESVGLRITQREAATCRLALMMPGDMPRLGDLAEAAARLARRGEAARDEFLIGSNRSENRWHNNG